MPAENNVNVKTFDELADLAAYKKAGKRCYDWLLDSSWTHRSYGAAEIEIPSDELVVRTLGIDPVTPYHFAVLESLVESEQHARHEPHFSTVPELLAHIDWHNGWRDMQNIANTIQAVRELLRKRETTYVGEIGEDFHKDFLKTCDDKQSKWDKKCDDPPTYRSISDMPTEYNILYRGLLERISEHCLKAAFKVSEEQSDWIIAKPESIAGHVIERTKPQEAKLFTKEEAQEISDGIKKFRNFAKARGDVDGT
jgi:hypothetical protein